MKYAVGYQLPGPDERPFAALVREFREHIEEVYFPWLDLPSGRAPIASRNGFVDWGAQARLEQDLADIAGQGVKLDLLLNASCYGARAASQEFLNTTLSLLPIFLSSYPLTNWNYSNLARYFLNGIALA